MSKGKYYTVKVKGISKDAVHPGEESEFFVTERQVRELASQLPKKVFLKVAREQLGLEYIEDVLEETEQQKVSDCCGADLLIVETGDDSYDWYACSECRTPCQEIEPCDDVEPEDNDKPTIKKIPTDYLASRTLSGRQEEIVHWLNDFSETLADAGFINLEDNQE